MWDGIFHIIMGFLGIIAVLFLAYYLTRFYAKRFGAVLGHSDNIKVIDRVPVGKGSSIAVIELQEKQYMVGITEHSINLITKLDENLPAPSSVEPMKFSDAGFFKTLKTAVSKESEEPNDHK